MQKSTLFLMAVVMTVFLFVPYSQAATYTWEQTSFTGDMIDSSMGRLLPHPTDPNKIYLATVNSIDFVSGSPSPADGLWMTSDKGVTWATINDGVLLVSYNIMDLAICTGNPDVMYAGTIEQGVFKTVDGGLNWTSVSSGLGFPNSDWAVMAVAVDPVDPDKVYISVAQVAGLDVFNLSPDHPGFFYSHNGGASWASNNSGLPPRYDSIWDGKSRTAAAGSIVIPPQAPNYVLLGMVDLSVNTALLFNKTASTDGRIFVNSNHGAGSFAEVSNGLPTGINQSPEISGSIARISSSIMMLSCSTGSNAMLWTNHTGLTFDLNLNDETIMTTRSKGVYFTQTGQWQARNSGLPYVASWTDNASTAGTTIRYIDTVHTGSVGMAPGNSSKICLVGSQRSDMGNASSNNTKVYASPSSGQPSWMKTWDAGLDVSPTYGYTEANAAIIAFNADMSCIFATIRWTDDVETNPLDGDNGVYRLVLQ